MLPPDSLEKVSSTPHSSPGAYQLPWPGVTSLQSLPPTSRRLLFPLCLSYKDACHWISSQPDNPGWSYLIIFHLIISEKSFFPNKGILKSSKV